MEGGRVGTENQLGSLGGEVGNAGNRGIFVVQLGVVSENFISLAERRVLAMRHGSGGDACGELWSGLGRPLVLAWGGGGGVMMASSRPVAMADGASGTSGTRHHAPGTGQRAKAA